jgi:hypothetical protein
VNGPNLYPWKRAFGHCGPVYRISADAGEPEARQNLRWPLVPGGGRTTSADAKATTIPNLK